MFPLQSWRTTHHASWNAAAEPHPGAVLLGDGGHRLPLVPDIHPAPGSLPLLRQPCLQVRFSPLLLLSLLFGSEPDIHTDCNKYSSSFKHKVCHFCHDGVFFSIKTKTRDASSTRSWELLLSSSVLNNHHCWWHQGVACIESPHKPSKSLLTLPQNKV